MTITNNGKTPDKVTCVSSDASAECQIHNMTMDNGVMMMQQVEGGFEIKPGETVTLKPSSLHVMLVNLKHPLEQGNTVKATLKFDTAGSIDVDYPIAAIGAAAPGVPAGGGTDDAGRRHDAEELAATRSYLPSLNGAFMPCGSGALKVLSVIDTMA